MEPAEYVTIPASLLWDLVDEDPCSFDHHGYCQAHGYFEIEPKCCHERAKVVLRQAGIEI